MQRSEKSLLALLTIFGTFAVFSFAVCLWLHLKGPPLDRENIDTLLTESSPGQYIPNVLTDNTYTSYYLWDGLPNVRYHSVSGTINSSICNTYPSIPSAEILYRVPEGRCAYVKRALMSTPVLQPSIVIGVASAGECSAFSMSTNINIPAGAPYFTPVFVRGTVMNPGESLAVWSNPLLNYKIDVISWDHVPGAPEGFRLWNVTQQASWSPPKGWEFQPYPRLFDRMQLSYTESQSSGTYDYKVEIDGMPWYDGSLNVSMPSYQPRVTGTPLPVMMKDDQTLTIDFDLPLSSLCTLEWNGMLRPKTE